ncbi:MAG: Fe-S cluster assembly protein SufB [Nanoarchaeota archaeon]|nr:Fe-S cluster assembly protein SufB [Nanoarchaeota archaeon]
MEEIGSNFSIDRSRYDDANLKSKSRFIAKPGIYEDLIRKISADKNEPDWMLKKRLLALKLFQKAKTPKWGPNLSELDLEKIVYYVDPEAREAKTWDDVPDDIKETFEKLGIPEAEREALSGVGAQYDSGMVYHKLKKEWEDKGIIFENMDVAVEKYPDLVKKHFMNSCVPINDHKFVMLHAAVWSGGTFIYVPPNTTIDIPLQAYFRMNQEAGGQFEHTLIIADKGSELHYIEGCSAPQYAANSLHAGCVEIHVLEGAKVKYSSIENWSKNTYNLNTKRAIVHKNAVIEWVNGNMGSGRTMLYPCSVLIGENSSSESLGIAFAGEGQDQDTGSKVIHIGRNTSSIIKAKSISKDGGISSYRGLVRVAKTAENAKSSVECDALMVDSQSVSNTYPQMDVERSDAHVMHEATVGKIGDEEIFYLMSKGLNEEQAKQMIVSGFANEVVKKLPLEYAVELNKLIELEMENSLG